MVHQQFRLPYLIFSETKCLKYIFDHLVTLSVPKVVENGQKVPILADFEIRLNSKKFCSFVDLDVNIVIILNDSEHVHCKNMPKQCFKCKSTRDFALFQQFFGLKLSF